MPVHSMFNHLCWPASYIEAIALDSLLFVLLCQMFAIFRRKVDHAWQTTFATTSARKTMSVVLLSTVVVRATAITLLLRRNATEAVEATTRRRWVIGCMAQVIVTFQLQLVRVIPWLPDGIMMWQMVTVRRSTMEDVMETATTSLIIMTVSLSAAKVKALLSTWDFIC